MISLRAAINGKCRDCIVDPLSGLGTWRQQVGACEAEGVCPLRPVRPRSKAVKAADSAPSRAQSPLTHTEARG